MMRLPGGTLREPDVAADRRAAADGDAAEHRRAGIDHHVVLDDRVARAALVQLTVRVGREALGAERDGLVQPDRSPITAVSPITTPVPWSMKKPAPICAPGWMSMPVRACACSATRRASSGTPSGRAVREPVVDHRGDAGIAEQHLVDAARGRVAAEGGQHVGVQ